MLRITVLGSGSRGNAILIDGTDGAVLVDAGFGPRSLVRRLKSAGRRPEEISALLLTHEHTDHASGAAAACARWGWPLYGSAGTLDALDAVTSTDSGADVPPGAPALAAHASSPAAAELRFEPCLQVGASRLELFAGWCYAGSISGSILLNVHPATSPSRSEFMKRSAPPPQPPLASQRPRASLAVR